MNSQDPSEEGEEGPSYHATGGRVVWGGGGGLVYRDWQEGPS